MVNNYENKEITLLPLLMSSRIYYYEILARVVRSRGDDLLQLYSTPNEILLTYI